MKASTMKASTVKASTGKVAGFVLAAGIVAVFPLLFTNPTASEYGVITLVFIAVVSAWNLFSGYSGYLSLGHAIFYGTGAYFLVVAAKDWNLTGAAIFWLLPLAGLAAAIIAVPLGLVALRVRRHTFVVITIAFFFIAQLSASNLVGDRRLLRPAGPGAGTGTPATYNNPSTTWRRCSPPATIGVSWLIRRSRFGLQLRAIRDDEDRAAGLGVRAMPVKLTALVHLGLHHRDGRRAVGVLHRPGGAAVRLRPAVRPGRRPDGILRRPRDGGRAGARRARAGADPAVPHLQRVQRLRVARSCSA